jgi:hypothetical protein
MRSTLDFFLMDIIKISYRLDCWFDVFILFSFYNPLSVISHQYMCSFYFPGMKFSETSNK